MANVPKPSDPTVATAACPLCDVFELVLYDCRLVLPIVECEPITRLFQRCPGEPLEEITTR
ncbi:hypothetical protein H4R33_007029, partial [Dimargaris cristalligena]